MLTKRNFMPDFPLNAQWEQMFCLHRDTLNSLGLPLLTYYGIPIYKLISQGILKYKLIYLTAVAPTTTI